MAQIQFLTILLTVTCFLGGVVSITDKEFENLVTSVHQQAATIGQLSISDNRRSESIKQLRKENKIMIEEIKRQNALIQKLLTGGNNEWPGGKSEYGDDFMANNTIEERVTLLEIQVMDMREDLTTIDENVTDLDEDVNFLFDETVLQDERLFSLEQDNDVINQELEDLQDVTLALQFRVIALENGVNSSVADLEQRVETLEGTASDLETRVTTSENDIEDIEAETEDLELRLTVVEEVGNQTLTELEVRVETLEGTAADHDTRLTVAEENIQGLQTTTVNLDDRVTDLEDNAENIAFHAVLTSYSSIPVETAVLFNVVELNVGSGYDSTTGTFTVPSGGDGYYYFSTYLLINGGEYGYFDIRVNEEILCTAGTDHDDTLYPAQAGCGGAVYVTEGDAIQVVYIGGFDTTVLRASTSVYYNGFTGFKLAT